MSGSPLRPGGVTWVAAAAGGLLLAVAVLGAVWLPGLPASNARIGPDYAFFLPNLLAGTFWWRANALAALPWFTPAQCGGFALHADPQGMYLSVTQALAVAFGPLPAVRIAFLLYGALGGAGAVWLARSAFRLSWAASVLAGVLFMFNGFYGVRMMVGHLGFAPFMLLPALAACMTGARRAGWRGEVMRMASVGLLLAAQIEGGMAALLAPCLLSLVVVAVMHGLASGGAVLPAFMRLAGGGLCGLAISAGKLAAMVSLVGNLPRDSYGLPGYDSLAAAGWVALRAVFLAPWPDMAGKLRNAHVHPFLHEFDYGVGPAAFVLMLAWAWGAWRRPAWPGRRAGSLWLALVVLLAVPLALNTYGLAWSTWLKTLPVLRQSTLLVRWFSAYILPATLGAAMALDRLRVRGMSGVVLCSAGTAGTLAALLVTVGGGRSFQGAYDPGPAQRAWRLAEMTGRVPAITRLEAAPAHGLDDFRAFLDGQNALVDGGSTLDCYQPLFGYGLENFRRGALHAGDVTARAGDGLNLKNPSCYVFPAANGCRPGDPFTQAQAVQAEAFAGYRPFAWRKPPWARMADWLGLLSFVSALAGFGWAMVARRRA